MKANHLSLTASLISCCLVAASAIGAETTFQILFQSRQPAPGTPANTIFSAFGSPVIGGVNQTAFPAVLEGPGVGTLNNDAIWNRSNGLDVLVEREGFPASGLGAGVTNNGFTAGSAVLNSSNQIAFQAALRGLGVSSLTDEGIWRGAPGSLVLVARKGSQAGGLAAGVNYSGFLPPALNLTGQIAFKASLTGVGVSTANNEGIWMGAPSGALAPVVRKGSQAAGLPASVLYDSLGSPVLNDNGQVAFKALVSGSGVGTFNNEAIWAGTPGSLAVVVRKGTQAAGLAASVNYDGLLTDPPAYNSSNQVAFVATLTGAGIGSFNDQGLWVGAPGAVALVAQKGSAAVGLPAGVNYNGFGRPVLSGSGQVAFKSSLTGLGVGAQNNQALWIGTAGSLSLIARSGSNAPGTAAGVLFSGFSDPLVNGAGLVVFKATLTGAGISTLNDEGFWSADAGGNVRLILQKGSLFDIGGGDLRTINSLTNELYAGNGEDGRPRTLNRAGQLVLNLGFLGGTNALVVANLLAQSPPAPAVLSISLANSLVQLSWTGAGFTLESAPTITGPWSPAADQSNPQSFPVAPGERYFRMRYP